MVFMKKAMVFMCRISHIRKIMGHIMERDQKHYELIERFVDNFHRLQELFSEARKK